MGFQSAANVAAYPDFSTMDALLSLADVSAKQDPMSPTLRKSFGVGKVVSHELVQPPNGRHPSQGASAISSSVCVSHSEVQQQ